MAIVTLISDWNKDDYYIAAIKGKILSGCPDATFVDISHQVPAFNIAHAGFLMRNSYFHFPKHTIHIIAVKSESDANHPYVAVRYNHHIFIGTDNGIFGLIMDDNPQEAIKLTDKYGGNFPALSVFADAACEIIKSRNFSELGEKHPELNRQVPMLPAIDEGMINGSIIYIDSYKNAITNISRDIFDQIGKGRPFEIFIQSNHFRITRINKSYNETLSGEILSLFNSIGLLEIAINDGNAADLLNLDVSSSVRVKFKEPASSKSKR